MTLQVARPLRSARIAQWVTASWMVVEGGVALAAGIAARSVALTAFGADSFIEVFSAGVVLHRLLTRSDAEASSDQLTGAERRAARFVGVALYVVAAYIVVSSIAALATRTRPDASTVGVAITLGSIAAMLPLWRWRLRLASALHSPALKADAACSAVCIYMAATALVGLALNRLFGWWWADPVAALALIWWIRGEAREALQSARTGTRDDCCD